MIRNSKRSRSFLRRPLIYAVNITPSSHGDSIHYVILGVADLCQFRLFELDSHYQGDYLRAFTHGVNALLTLSDTGTAEWKPI